MDQQKQWHECDKCGKNLSSYHSLWRHKKKCLQDKIDVSTNRIIGEKRKRSEAGERPSKNPEIQALTDAIINGNNNNKFRDVEGTDRRSQSSPASREHIACVNSRINDMSKSDSSSSLPVTQSRLPLATSEMVTDEFKAPRSSSDSEGDVSCDNEDDDVKDDDDDDEEEKENVSAHLSLFFSQKSRKRIL